MELNLARFNTNSISKILLLTVCLSGFAFAGFGVIRGRVLDKTTGLSLAGANVIVEGTDNGCATGTDGTFALTNLQPGEVRLIVSMIGYGSARQTCVLYPNSVSEVYFALESIILETGQNITVIGRSGENLTVEQYRNANLTSTEDMIARLEGVNLITRGNFAQEPIFRGLSGGQVNITIDGMKCFGACTDRMDPVSSYIEVDALNSVELGQGALALENGATIGGSLNMTHSRPEFMITPTTNWSVRAEAQTAIKGQKTACSWARNNPGWGLIINATYRRAGDYTSGQGQQIPFTAYEKINYNLGLLKRLSDRSEFYLDFIGDDAFDVGYAALPMDVGYAQMRLLGLSTLTTGIRPWWPRFEIKVYGNFVNHWMDDSKRDSLFMNMHMDMPGFTRTAGAYADAVFIPADGQLLQVRSEFYRSTYYADMVMYPIGSSPMEMVTWPGVVRWNAGQYLEYQLALQQHMTMKAALRYDVFWSEVTDPTGQEELHIAYPNDPLQRVDHLFTGNLFLDYRINPAWQTTVAIASGQRIPTITEAYGYYLYVAFDGYLYSGNPNLKPERSLQLEWRNRVETDWFDVGINLYRYNLVDYIFGAVNPDGIDVHYAKGWKDYQNSGNAFIHGLELSVLSELDWHWSVFGGLSYETGRLTDLNDNLPMIPPLSIHGAIKYRRYPWWIQLETKWNAAQPDYSLTSGENATAAYLIIGLRSEYVLTDGIKINVGIDNLMNNSYHDHLDWADVPRPGRNIYLSIAIDDNLFNYIKREL